MKKLELNLDIGESSWDRLYAKILAGAVWWSLNRNQTVVVNRLYTGVQILH